MCLNIKISTYFETMPKPLSLSFRGEISTLVLGNVCPTLKFCSMRIPFHVATARQFLLPPIYSVHNFFWKLKKFSLIFSSYHVKKCCTKCEINEKDRKLHCFSCCPIIFGVEQPYFSYSNGASIFISYVSNLSNCLA